MRLGLERFFNKKSVLCLCIRSKMQFKKLKLKLKIKYYKIICKITILFCIYLEMSCIPVMKKQNFQQPLLQSLVLHDPQEIIFNMLIWSTKIISHNVINITLQCTVYIYSYIDGFIYLKNDLPLWDRNYVAVYFCIFLTNSTSLTASHIE